MKEPRSIIGVQDLLEGATLKLFGRVAEEGSRGYALVEDRPIGRYDRRQVARMPLERGEERNLLVAGRHAVEQRQQLPAAQHEREDDSVDDQERAEPAS